MLTRSRVIVFYFGTKFPRARRQSHRKHVETLPGETHHGTLLGIWSISTCRGLQAAPFLGTSAPAPWLRRQYARVFAHVPSVSRPARQNLLLWNTSKVPRGMALKRTWEASAVGHALRYHTCCCTMVSCTSQIRISGHLARIWMKTYTPTIAVFPNVEFLLTTSRHLRKPIQGRTSITASIRTIKHAPKSFPEVQAGYHPLFMP